MQTKNNSLFLTIITGLLVVAAVASIGFYISRPQTSAAAVENVEKQISPVNNIPDASSKSAYKSVLSNKVNDITVEITSAKIISTGVEIGICYTTLDGGDWYPVPGHLFYSTHDVYPDEYEFTTEQKADANNLGRRCVLVRYRVDDLSTIVAPLQFSLADLVAHPREMPACQNFQERLDTNSKAKAYGLKAKCIETADGNVAVTLVSNNNSVAKDKASKLLDDIAKGEVAGPWEFTITELENSFQISKTTCSLC
jgi:hypothetical protein